LKEIPTTILAKGCQAEELLLFLLPIPLLKLIRILLSGTLFFMEPPVVKFIFQELQVKDLA